MERHGAGYEIDVGKKILLLRVRYFMNMDNEIVK